MGAWYAWREDVRAATDSKTTARDDALIDRCLGAATESVAGLCHREFAPTLATRSFEWPNLQRARPWRLWLDKNELISVSVLSSGGTIIDPADYLLEPNQYGPPYDRIELDQAGPAAFGGGSTHQRDITITGLFGYRNAEVQVGTITDPLGASGSAGLSISADTGVGAVLRIDNERIVVADKTMVDSGQDVGGAGLTASMADVALTVADPTQFDAGQVILGGAERMLVVDVSSVVVVKRAWDGTVLAAHAAGESIFSLTGYSVRRGELGTVAAAHADNAPVYRWEPPALVRELTTAEAIVLLQQHGAAWARTVGSGESEREAGGRGIKDLRAQCYREHGRQARMRAV
jgi:hypothetical protein